MIVQYKHFNQKRLNVAIVFPFALAIILFFPFSIRGNSTSKVINVLLVVQNSINTNQKPQQKPTKETIKNTPIVHIGNTGVKTCFDIEKEPEFKGGEKALIKFMNVNIHYPLIAQKAGVEGTIIVRFVVNIQGKVSDVKLKKGIGSGCDEEAVRVIKAMPAWNPGRNNGKVVPVMVDIPIEFQLINRETGDVTFSPKGLIKDDKNLPLKYVEQKPQFKGGNVAMLKFLKDKMNYPIAAKNSGFQGTVIVQFVVEETGKISRVKILRGYDNACNEEALRLVKSMPNWIPGRMNGQAVPSIFQIPIQFQLQKAIPKEPVSLTKTPKVYYFNVEDPPFQASEQYPEYNGGYDAMLNFLKNNIKYPDTAKKSGIQGTVFVQFVVEKTGKISKIKILRGISKECDEEAIRLVNSMPIWIPGRQNGQAVPVMFQIPVKFQLAKKY